MLVFFQYCKNKTFSCKSFTEKLRFFTETVKQLQIRKGLPRHAVKATVTRDSPVYQFWHPQQESNPYQQYRKLLFYPLNYGGMPAYFITYWP